MIKILFLLLLLFNLSFSSDKTFIYFYSPYSDINDFQNLKYRFDNYLKRFGDYEFQPFTNKKSFENRVLKDRNSILIMSSFEFDDFKSRYRDKLKIEFLASKNGKEHQNMILLSNDNSFYFTKKSKVSTSCNEKHSKFILKKILQKSINNIDFITVERDIDAILSIVFNISDFALVSNEAFEKYKNIFEINENLFKVGSSLNSLHLVIATFDNHSFEVESFIDSLESKDKDSFANGALSLIGVDILKKESISYLNEKY